MKKFLFSVIFACLAATGAVADDFVSCGPGYVLVSHSDIDGIDAAECQKLWCRDLENGKTMGSGDRAASGYKDTSYPMELCDADGNCVECFGDRRWCSGENPGYWNAEYGAYTYDGADNATYSSYQKGSCFAWRLESPDCPDGQTAILSGGQWICATEQVNTSSAHQSSIRRTGGTLRRPIR